MSMTFTKLFASITESTVWCEPDHVRIVWITMLAMADRHGRVWGSIPGLANRARKSIGETEDALSRFQSPDRYSRTPDNEGRRIETIDGGWRILNHEKYREIRDSEAIKESKRRYINARRERERVEKEVENVENVDRGRHNADADTDADTEVCSRGTLSQKENTQPTKKRKSLAQAPFVLPDDIPELQWQAWIDSRTKARKTPTEFAKRLAVSKLRELAEQGHHPAAVLAQSAFNGWSGLFPLKKEAS